MNRLNQEQQTLLVELDRFIDVAENSYRNISIVKYKG